jgi:hypothetical protein
MMNFKHYLRERKVHPPYVRVAAAALTARIISQSSAVSASKNTDEKLNIISRQLSNQAIMSALSIATSSRDPIMIKNMKRLTKKI